MHVSLRFAALADPSRSQVPLAEAVACATIVRSAGFAEPHPAPGHPGPRVRDPGSKRRSFSHHYRSRPWSGLLPSQGNRTAAQQTVITVTFIKRFGHNTIEYFASRYKYYQMQCREKHFNCFYSMAFQ